jgi:hypothetical protein
MLPDDDVDAEVDAGAALLVSVQSDARRNDIHCNMLGRLARATHHSSEASMQRARINEGVSTAAASSSDDAASGDTDGNAAGRREGGSSAGGGACWGSHVATKLGTRTARDALLLASDSNDWPAVAMIELTLVDCERFDMPTLTPDGPRLWPAGNSGRDASAWRTGMATSTRPR